MALQKKTTTAAEAPPEVTKPADNKQRIADAQAKVKKDREAGATASAAAAHENVPLPDEEKLQDAEAPEEKAVVQKAPAGAVAKPRGKINRILQDRINVMIAPYGSFPRIKTGSGNLTDGVVNYGSWIEFEMLSYNELFIISPNEDSKDKAVQDEAKGFMKYSYDGVNLDDGSGLVVDYIAKLQAEDYPDASVKNYRECVGILMDCEKAAVAEDVLDKIVQIQLSPTSRTQHEGYIMANSFHVNRGVCTEDEVCLMKIKAKATSGGGFDWTVMNFARIVA